MTKPDWSLAFEVMCDASDYAVGAVLGQRIDKHFKPIHYASKMMNEAQENYTTTKKELLAIIFAFDKFPDHLSRLENPDLGKLTKAEIRDLFPKERLMAISNKNNEPWCVARDKATQILRQCHGGLSGGHHGIATTARKVFEAGFYWKHMISDARKYNGLGLGELVDDLLDNARNEAANARIGEGQDDDGGVSTEVDDLTYVTSGMSEQYDQFYDEFSQMRLEKQRF
uniref:Uncharacterized protein n=1 Tax=Tanacetum cinerariifolium TaxID=118510 RepID=A0A6L2JLY1_TANCI|nr:hypothetical protein [Tanacetum cinerariifolium]